jgi:indolepyruvate ferredoxin oxidoreductase
MVDPPKRAFINEAVCEGCGDCGTASNCVSVIPVETELGRKRAIDQSSCNKDMSCLKGFCPSFVTVHGGNPRKRASGRAGGEALDAALALALPEPTLPTLDEPYGVVAAGIGGTGVVTIGALLAMAAHIEGRGCTTLDMTGLAQKGGSVVSHIRIAQKPEDIHAVRIAAGGARLVVGCDVVVTGSFDVLAKAQQGKTSAVINTQQVMTGHFTRNPDMQFPLQALEEAIVEATGRENARFVDAGRVATALLGDSIAVNLFMLGHAYQQGLVPVSAEAIERAIELNAVAVEFNKASFDWGRRYAHDAEAVERAIAPAAGATVTALPRRKLETLDEIVADRVTRLTAYQDAGYARRYEALVRRVAEAERARTPGMTGLALAAARYLYKLMAYKDEYEVARLYTDGEFKRRLAAAFDGDYTLEFHLAPPIMAARDPQTGHLVKRGYGPWMMRAFGLLAGFKFLRGSPFDPFGRTAERKMERRLIVEYEGVLGTLMAGLDHQNHALAVQIAELPEHIRGYGHVKERHLEEVKRQEADLIATFRAPPAPARVAAE